MAASYFPEPPSRSSGAGKDTCRPVLPPASSSRLVVPGLSLLAAALGTGITLFAWSKVSETRRSDEEARLQTRLNAEITRLSEEARLRKIASTRRADELASQLGSTTSRLQELDDSRADLQARLAAAEASQKEALNRLAAAEQRHRESEIARSAETLRAEQAKVYAEREERSQRIIDQQVAESLREREELRNAALSERWWMDDDSSLYNLRDELTNLRETTGVRYPRVTTVVSRVENEVTAAEARLASLNSEVFLLDQQCRQIEQERQQLAMQVQQLEQENKKLSAKVDDLTCQVDILTGKKPPGSTPAGAATPAAGSGSAAGSASPAPASSPAPAAAPK